MFLCLLNTHPCIDLLDPNCTKQPRWPDGPACRSEQSTRAILPSIQTTTDTYVVTERKPPPASLPSALDSLLIPATGFLQPSVSTYSYLCELFWFESNPLNKLFFLKLTNIPRGKHVNKHSSPIGLPFRWNLFIEVKHKTVRALYKARRLFGGDTDVLWSHRMGMGGGWGNWDGGKIPTW